MCELSSLPRYKGIGGLLTMDNFTGRVCFKNNVLLILDGHTFIGCPTIHVEMLLESNLSNIRTLYTYLFRGNLI